MSGKLPRWQEDGMLVTRTVCRICHSHCGLLIYTRDGRIIKAEPDKEQPDSEGNCCAKGLAITQWVDHPNRLKYPLKRMGAKGEGKWERITWDEALDTVAGKLTEYKENFGGESVCLSSGTDRGFISWPLRFANAFGTPNCIGPGYAQCYMPMLEASRWFCGPMLFTQNHIDPDSKCVVIVGMEPMYGKNMNARHRLFDAKDRGMKLIVIDPAFSTLASKADIWLQIRPATDGALALGWLNVIINEGLYDKEFVEKWTVGFDKLREHVQEWTPERVADITWVPADKIRKAARLYATSKPAMLDCGVALEQYPNSFDTNWLFAILIAIAGNIDVKGGTPYLPSIKGKDGMPIPQVGTRDIWGANGILRYSLPEDKWDKRLGAKEFPLLSGRQSRSPFAHTPQVWRAIITGKPYPIKAILNVGSNPMNTQGDLNTVYEAMMKIEFLVVMDLFMTPTAELADIVLPAATFLERDDLQDPIYRPPAMLFPRPKVIEPVGEAWDDKKMFIELGHRLGLHEAYPWRTVEEYLDWYLEPSGLTFKQLVEKVEVIKPPEYKKYEKTGFFPASGSGKCDIYSEALKAMGHNPLPTFREPPESPYSTPELAKDYPLILTTGGRAPTDMHSEMSYIPWLRELLPDIPVEINPQTAAQYGIKDGEMIVLESLRGGIKIKAKITEGVDSRVVRVRWFWWFMDQPAPEHGWRDCVNVLTNIEGPYDPMMGTYQLRGMLCRVRKLQPGEEPDRIPKKNFIETKTRATK